MKVLQFISYLADSQYISNLGSGLSQRGIDVSCGTLFQTGIEEPEWMKKNRSGSYFCLNARTKRDFPLAISKLARILRRERPDILQTHLYEASFVGLWAVKLVGVPIKILTRHHTDQAHVIGKKLPIAVDRWEARQADKIVVLSNAVRDFMIKGDGIDGDKITVIYQGFDFEKFSATNDDRTRIRSEFGLSEDDFVLGTFGNFFPTKGHSFIVSAAKELVKDIPDLKLMFVGDGGDKSNLKKQIAEEGMTERVIFTGLRQDVGACMKAVDAVVHPSLSEAFCQVLVETMSVGTPLISTDVGGAKEVITDGETGVLIPPKSVEAIAEAVKNFYTNRDCALAIAEAGKRSVHERFTIEKMISKQVECYEEWLNDKK